MAFNSVITSEKAMAHHSSTLAWKIPWIEEPGGLQSMGSQRVKDTIAPSLSLFTFMHWRRTCQPTPEFLPGESQGWRSLVGYHYGVTQTRTRLKRLSSSSSMELENVLIQFFYIAVQYSQHQLLKSLSFIHCIFLPLFSQINI